MVDYLVFLDEIHLFVEFIKNEELKICDVLDIKVHTRK